MPGGYGTVMFLAMAGIMPAAVPQQLGRIMVYKLGGRASLPAPQPLEGPIPTPPVLHASEVTLKQGATLYQTFCWPCHGASAVSSGVLPDLRRSPVLQDGAAWKSLVIDGVRKDNGMRSFAQWMSAAEAEAIRAYVAGEAERAEH